MNYGSSTEVRYFIFNFTAVISDIAWLLDTDRQSELQIPINRWEQILHIKYSRVKILRKWGTILSTGQVSNNSAVDSYNHKKKKNT